MPSKRSPSWQKTRKKHSPKIRKIRKEAMSHTKYADRRGKDSPNLMRDWFIVGRGGNRYEGTDDMSILTARTRVERARAGDPEYIYLQSRFKDARNYAARLKKKKGTKGFVDWLYPPGSLDRHYASKTALRY